MKRLRLGMIAQGIACAGLLAGGVLAWGASPQKTSEPAYMNPNLPAKVRAEDLVSRMTLKEKASQMVNGARAIPRLHIPAYNWWSEALHGVAVNGTTEFPEPIGLGATFDPAGIHQMGKDISLEGRVVYEESVKDGNSVTFHGLDFWAPNVNIFRDPRWGRGQETYGEDPFLTSQMAVAYVTGMQGSNPKFYRVIATPKHFDAHSGPEPIRHFSDYDVSKHDLEDTYLPAFRAAIVKGHADSIMCAYTGLNGQPDCANEFLLQKELRQAWGFKGYVVSDCDAVHDIFTGHHYRPSQAQATAISVERGMDNECYGVGQPTTDVDYKPYIEAVQKGYLSESALDNALVHLFTARFKLGLLDPPGMDPYSNIPKDELNSPAHRALALKLANESMVLLKNDGVLPLKSSVKRIAIVGPLADQKAVLLGNYNGTPTKTVTMLEGMKAEFPNAKITYVPGIQFLSKDIGTVVPASALTTPSGKPGIQAEYFAGMGMGMMRPMKMPKPLVSRVEETVDLNGTNLPAQLKGKKGFFVRWTGTLNPTATGNYYIGIRANGFAMVSVGGQPYGFQYGGNGDTSNVGQIHLERGVPLTLSVAYGARGAATPKVQLVWAKVDNAASPAAVEAAKKADVVIAVVGLTSHLESEEAPVHEPGFLGGDRTRLRLPQPEENLLHAVAETGKPLVVVLMNGSALAVNWANTHASAILESWYSGEEGGAAIADTLSGKNDPGGKLPVTFYTGISQLPNFANYSMQGRTYRYFTGKPLYPFGYGLSYTKFSFSNLELPQKSIEAGDPLKASVTVTNTGKVAGDEVVQLYLKFPKVPGRPNIALRGFQRVHLQPGQSQQVHFDLKRRALSMVTENGNPIVAQGDYTVSVGGGQPDTGVQVLTDHFHVNGQVMLAK